MPNVRVHRQSVPDNVPNDGSSGNWTITVTGTYNCGNAVQNFDLSAATMGTGRWVLVRALGANSITGYVGATVTPPTSPLRTVLGVSHENVRYRDTTYDCIVVTLV